MGRFSAIALLVVAVAAVGLAWGLGAFGPPPAGAAWAASPVTAGSIAVLVLAIVTLVPNAQAVADRVRMPTPPVIEHPVLGALTYRDGTWTARPGAGPAFWCRDRRIGPDPALLEAAADAWPRLPEWEATARAWLAGIGRAADTYGALHAVTARPVHPPRAGVFEIVLLFDLPDSDDGLDVIFRDGAPVDWDQH
jgi:hypothetical protein